MKLLHTSDLHLGKCLLEESLYQDQKYILDEIINIVKDNNIDVVMISGDIFDKSIPSIESTVLFDKFLTSLSKLNKTVLIVSGNHDSSERLSYGSNIFNEFNIHIVTKYDGFINKVSIDNVDFYLLPFIKPVHLKHLMSDKEYESINTSNEMFKWILNRETIDKSKVNILLTHQFFMWDGKTPLESDSESISLNSVGTIDAIDVNLLDDFDYVAGGHIHRPQKIKRDTIRYSGSPLKYSFSEVSDNKSVVIIDTNDINNLEFISLKPLRELRCIRGSFDEVMKMDISDDIIRVELTDENNFLSPMEEIRKRFKNAISLVFVNKYKESDDSSYFSSLNDSPYFLFKSFFKEQNGRELNDDEDSYISDLIKSIEED